MTMVEATALAVGIGVLFVFRAHMASMAGNNWYVAGGRMGLAGLVVDGPIYCYLAEEFNAGLKEFAPVSRRHWEKSNLTGFAPKLGYTP